MRPLPLLRDFAIVFGLTFLGGAIIGFLWSFNHWNPSAYLPGLMLSNLVFGSLGFLIVGLLTRQGRWRHLLQVALAVWIGGLINLLLGASLISWALSLIFIFLIMGIGGVVASLALPETGKADDQA